MKSLCLLRKHEKLGFVEVVSHLVHFFDDRRILDLPSLIVLLLKQFNLFCVKDSLSLFEFELGTLDKHEGLLKADSSLFPLVLKMGVQRVINHEALMKCQLAVDVNQVTHALVKVRKLRYFSALQDQFLKCIKFDTQLKIMLGQLLGCNFNLFAFF